MKIFFFKNTPRIVPALIALFFIGTSLVKIFSFPQFVVDVQRFDILSGAIVLPFSLVIVMTEFIAGTGLLMNIHKKLCSIALIFLLVLFAIAIVINVLQDNIIDCGCYGNIVSSNISWWNVVRNISLAVILAWFTFARK